LKHDYRSRGADFPRRTLVERGFRVVNRQPQFWRERFTR
jgi:hypothetical protein